MAVVINTAVDSNYFTLNGTRYARIYQPLKGQVSTEVGIYNAFDTCQQLLNSTPYDEFLVDGFSFATADLLIIALLPVIYKYQGTGAVTGSIDWGSIGGTLSAQLDLQAALDLKSVVGHTHSFASLTSKPTTLTGFGITDAYTETEVDSLLSGKADNSHTHLAADITDSSTAFVDFVTNQYAIGGEKTFTGAVVKVTGRLGVDTEVFGGSRLGDSAFQTPQIDVNAINIKDGTTQLTPLAIFATAVGGSDGYTVTMKNFVDDVYVWSLSGVGAAVYADTAKEVETTLGLRNDHTGGEFTVFDMFNQDYPTGVSTEVRQAQGFVAIHGGGAAKKKVGLWRYDTTTYTTIWELDTSDNFTFGVNVIHESNVNPDLDGSRNMGTDGVRWNNIYQNKSFVEELIFTPTDTVPSSPVEGMSYWDDSENTIKIYDGTAWVALGSGGGGGTWGSITGTLSAQTDLQAALDAKLTTSLVLSSSGDRFGVIPHISTGGVMEVGRYLDFHNVDTDTGDYDVRLEQTGGTLRLHGGANDPILEAYDSASAFARLTANSSGGAITLADVGGTASIIRGYGDSDFYGGYIIAHNGGLVTGEAAGFAGIVTVHDGAAGSCSLSYEDNFLRWRRGSAGTINGYRWDSYDTQRMLLESDVLTIGTSVATGGTGDIKCASSFFNGATYWQVSNTDSALQRCDARSVNTDEAKLHWYGTDGAAANTGVLWALYDSGSYIDYSVLNDVVTYEAQSSNPLTLELKSLSSVTLHLEADTDNITETHNPLFKMSQDGGLKSYEVSMASGAGAGLTFTQSNDVWIRTGTTTENFVWGGGTTGRMTLDNGNGNLTLHNGGLTVGSTADVTLGSGDVSFTSTGTIIRSETNEGYLVGSYNADGALTTSTGCIYTMGTSFKPNKTTLGNMYGVGYAYGSASFLNSTDLGTTPASKWGAYVAADGNARIWFNATDGITRQKGVAYASNFILNSDERVKNSIKPYIPAELGIDWVSFELNSEKGQYRVGASAQKLLANPHTRKFVNEEDKDNYTVNYIDLHSAALAEKDRQINSLSFRLEQMEAKIELLIKELL